MLFSGFSLSIISSYGHKHDQNPVTQVLLTLSWKRRKAAQMNLFSSLRCLKRCVEDLQKKLALLNSRTQGSRSPSCFHDLNQLNTSSGWVAHFQLHFSRIVKYKKKKKKINYQYSNLNLCFIKDNVWIYALGGWVWIKK